MYINRGCQETVQLQHLDQHQNSCGFAPVICSNQGCAVTVNKRDLVHHESEVCEQRKLKCHSCEEMVKTLADVGKRVEKNMSTNLTVKTEMAVLRRNVSDLRGNLANMETNVKRDIADIKVHFEEELKAVSDEVVEVKATLVEACDQIRHSIKKVESMMEENPRKKRRIESSVGENIIVAGGMQTNSVEMFNWRQRTWLPLPSMPQELSGATSFVYNDYVTMVGGHCVDEGFVADMIRMNIGPYPNLSLTPITPWIVPPAKLPAQLAHHSSVLYNESLIVAGGLDENSTSDYIDEVHVVPPYAVKTLSSMPEPRQGHCAVIFDDSMLILGGSTSSYDEDSLSSVVLYDIKNDSCKQLAQLPYEVMDMASVRWGDNVIVIGGVNKGGNSLETVIIYNVTTQQSHMLPPMRCKRRGCTAVVVGNNIVVLGGKDEENELNSVEAFNFQRYTWQDLPEMSGARWLHTAVVV